MVLRLFFSLLAVCAVGLAQDCTSVSLSPASASVPVNGGIGLTFIITASPSGCVRAATSNNDWITLTSSGGVAGTQTTIIYSVAPNTTTQPRSGTISINSGLGSFTVTQPGVTCTYALTPATAAIGSSGGPGTIQVAVNSACSWTATSADPFVTITGNGSGAGAGQVSYLVDANPSLVGRSTSITIGAATFIITQSGAPACTSVSLSPVSASPPATGAIGTTFTATVSPSGCLRAATSNNDWITVTSSSGATGTQSLIVYTVAANNSTQARTGTISINNGLGTFTVLQPGQTCTFALTPSSASIPVTGGSGSIQVSVNSACSWTATSSDSWVSVTGGGSGTGSGTVSYSVDPNPNAVARSATIAIGTATFTVTQSAPASTVCTSVTLSPASASASVNGASGLTFTITASPAGCIRTATSNNDWITITGSTGTSATQTLIVYTVAPNASTQSRTGSISINGGLGLFTVLQASTTCNYTLIPQSATVLFSGGAGTITINTNASCAWTAVSNETWVTITSNNSGSGNGSIDYTVDPNPTNVGRTATITIGTNAFNITQTGPCSFTLSPNFSIIIEKATTGTLTVTASATSCTRSAGSDVTWLTVTSGASATGNGSVGYKVDANTTSATRIGHITVGDATFTVTQNGANCAFALVPTSKNYPSSGGSGVFALTTTCSWTVTVSDPWIVFTSSASGTGNFTFNYSVASNPTALKRNGSIAVGTNLFFLSQDGATCNITLPSSAIDVPAAGVTGAIIVNAGQGCGWSATSNAAWLTINGPAGGAGDGNVSYIAAPNTTAAARTGIITIGNKLYTVTQGGATCDFAINPTSASIPAGAFNASINVTTTCNWTAVPSASWISITSGATATTGNGAVSYSVGSNPSGQPRSGTIKIATQTFSLTQEGGACTLTLAPATNSVAGPATSGRFAVTGSTTGCTWKATSNVPWITIGGYSSVNGSGAVDFSIETNPTVSPRTGTITVGTETFTITQSGSVPAITAAGILNAASFLGGAIAPGEILTIFGTFIGTTPLTTLQLNDAKAGITNSLGSTRVLFDGVAAPMVYSSATQTSAIVPYSVAGKTTTSMTVEYQGATSNAVTLNVALASPAIFSLDQSGKGPGAVLNQDFSLNSAANAAARNTIVQIFATGEGATNPVGVDGKLAVAPLTVPTQTVTVRIGNIDAPVVYRGGAPGLVAGVIQINARVPQTAPVGAAVPIVVRVGNIDSPAGMTIAVK